MSGSNSLQLTVQQKIKSRTEEKVKKNSISSGKMWCEQYKTKACNVQVDMSLKSVSKLIFIMKLMESHFLNNNNSIFFPFAL